MLRKVFLALDAHAHHCVLGRMDTQGHFLGDARFVTRETDLIRHVVGVEAREKVLTVEEGPLSRWIAQTLRPYVADVFICDPRRNKSISRNLHKRDELDVIELCRLLRLDALHRVYHPAEDHRAIFKALIAQYIDFRDEEVRQKQRIKAFYRQWGVLEVDGLKVYSPAFRDTYLDQLCTPAIRLQMERHYRLMEATLVSQRETLRAVCEWGQRYPEIARFQKIPGVGVVGSHLFDAYIQTPHRFSTKQELWRYCQLGVVDRSSDGKPLGYQRLDYSGNSELKAMSYHAWKGSLQTREDNEVRRFFMASLHRTHNRVHARLNTQRKILAVMWALWRKEEDYDPQRFNPSVPSSAEPA